MFVKTFRGVLYGGLMYGTYRVCVCVCVREFSLPNVHIVLARWPQFRSYYV